MNFRAQIWEEFRKFQQKAQLITPFTSNGYRGQVRVHKGYYRAYLSVQAYLLNICRDTDLDIQINGHSSGGCISQIAGVDINYRLKKSVRVVTFGTPAIGNQAWKISANKRISNTGYLNLLDPVPYLLLCNKHLANQITINKLYFDPHSIKNYAAAFK